MDILRAAEQGIPVEYLRNGKSVFSLPLSQLTKMYGEIEGYMIRYKATEEYIPSSLFIGEGDFMARYASWSRRYSNLLKKTLLDAKTIASAENRLSRTPKLTTGKPTVERKFKRYTLKLREKLFDTTNFIEIFDSIEPSYENPLVYLKTDETFLVKIVNDPDFKDVNYTNILEKTAEKGLSVYKFIKGSDPRNVISYIRSDIILSETQGEIFLETQLDWRDVLNEDEYQRISDKIIRINFNFSIKYRDDISWAAFLYAINTSDFLGKWLFLFETTSAYIISDENVEKFYIGFRYAIPQKEDTSSLGNFRIISEGSRLVIKASKVSSEGVMDLMYEYIPRLLRWFCDHQEDFINEIKLLVPDFVHHKRELQDVPLTKYKALENVLPALFAKDESTRDLADVDGVKYGSVCQCKRQPVFIEEDEVENVKNFRLENGEERTVRFFPPRHPKLGLPEDAKLFFCPTEDTPYPSMRSNVDPATLKRYPMIPHCVKIDNYLSAAETYYSKSQDPSENISWIASGSQPISSKRLEKGSVGKIEDKINTFLKLTFDIYFDDVEFVRLGMKNVSKESILECIVAATGKFEGESLRKIRETIFFDAKAVQMHQTLWYLDREQIDEHLLEMATSNDILDSKIYLPILEEIFDVSIYVLDSSGYEIPSSKGFFVKTPPKKDCIILWKYSPDTIVNHPTYDLIVPVISGAIPVAKSLKDLNDYRKLTHKIHENSTKFFGFKENRNVWYKFGACVFEISEEFIKKKKLKEFAVSLDHFGKVAIRHVISADGTRFSIRVPPGVASLDSEIIDSEFPQSLERVTAVFGRPRSVDAFAWYSYDLHSNEIGVVLESVTRTETNYDLENIISRSKLLKEVVDYLLGYIDNSEDKKKFLDLIKVDNSVKLFSIEGNYLPRFDSFDSALEFLEKQSPNFSEGKFLLKDFSVASVKEYIMSYNTVLQKQKEGCFLIRNFSTKMDFSLASNTRIFQSQKELDAWNFSRERQEFFEVDDRLEPRNNVYTHHSNSEIGESLYFIHPVKTLQDAKSLSQKFLFPYIKEVSDLSMYFEEIDGKIYRKKTETAIKDVDIFSQVLRYFNGGHAAVVEVFRTSI